MADMHTTEQGGEADRALIRDEASTLPGHALPGGPDLQLAPVTAAAPLPTRVALDADTTRDEIVQTRARMSETIDQIEEQLLRKKQRLQEQLDVRGQIRERLTPVREVVYGQPLLVFGGGCWRPAWRWATSPAAGTTTTQSRGRWRRATGPARKPSSRTRAGAGAAGRVAGSAVRVSCSGGTMRWKRSSAS